MKFIYNLMIRLKLRIKLKFVIIIINLDHFLSHMLAFFFLVFPSTGILLDSIPAPGDKI